MNRMNRMDGGGERRQAGTHIPEVAAWSKITPAAERCRACECRAGGAALEPRRVRREGEAPPGARTCRRQRHFPARPSLALRTKNGGLARKLSPSQTTLGRHFSRRRGRRREKQPLRTAYGTVLSLVPSEFLEYGWKA